MLAVRMKPLRMTLQAIPNSRRAFTLIELLTVIAIIGVLAAMLLPALAGAKERSRRAACKSHMHQFILALHMYASDHFEKLPSGMSELGNGTDEHIPIIPRSTRDSLIKYGGSSRILDCPSLGKPFNRIDGWFEAGYGFVIGYNYHGGHTNTPWPQLRAEFIPWISPRNMTDNNQLVLLTDMNDWSPGYGATFAPHGARGPIYREGNFMNPSARGASPRDVGAVGGHVGLLDGSVNWKPIKQMQPHQGSRMWDDSGCFALW